MRTYKLVLIKHVIWFCDILILGYPLLSLKLSKQGFFFFAPELICSCFNKKFRKIANKVKKFWKFCTMNKNMCYNSLPKISEKRYMYWSVQKRQIWLLQTTNRKAPNITNFVFFLYRPSNVSFLATKLSSYSSFSCSLYFFFIFFLFFTKNYWNICAYELGSKSVFLYYHFMLSNFI
jgi:hypothetical protein